MIFTNDKAIYIQMADRLCDEILAGKYKDDDRIPSVREYAVMLEVNANTAVKAYDELSRANIIYNKRGLGYFVTPGAKKQILNERKQEFMKERLPELFRQMQLLGITLEDVKSEYTATSAKDAAKEQHPERFAKFSRLQPLLPVALTRRNDNLKKDQEYRMSKSF